MPAFSSPAHTLLALVSARTGRPAGVLTADLELTADLRLDSLARVELLAALRTRLPDLPKISIADVCEFRTLGEFQAAVLGDFVRHPVRHVVTTVPVSPPGLRTAHLRDALVITDCGGGIAEQVRTNLATQGIVATVVDEVPSGATGVIFLGGLREDVSNSQTEALHAAREERALFVTVQDTGGDFGQSGTTAERSSAGGIAGLTRYLCTEWTDSVVRALDIPRGPDAARQITEELLHGGATFAVGYRDGVRRELGTEPHPLPETDGTAHQVIVATGASFSLLALARELRPRIVLLGTAHADPHPSARDEPAVKRAILNHAKDLSPVRVIELAAEVIGGRGLRACAELLTEAGAQVRVLDRAADLDAVRVEWGPVTGIVHDACTTPFEALAATIAATGADPVAKVCVVLATPTDRAHAMGNEMLTHLAYAHGWTTLPAGDATFVREFTAKGATQIAPEPRECAFRAEVPPSALLEESYSPLALMIEWFVAASGATTLRDVSLLRDPATGIGPVTVRSQGKRVALVSNITHGRATIAAARPPAGIDTTSFVTVRGARALGWPVEHGRTDPAALDECFRIAARWAKEAFSGTAVPTGVREVRVHRTGLLSAAGKVAMSTGRVHDGRAECDVALMDTDGSVRVELLGISLTRHPR